MANIDKIYKTFAWKPEVDVENWIKEQIKWIINKAVHKLKGLPPVYVINLDGEPHRWKAAEDMLKYWEVKTIHSYICI